jgi:tetratricopeptide (TPR) repeat protein
LAAEPPTPAQEPTADVQFRDAYRMVQLADSAYEKEEWPRSREFYAEALDAYTALRRKFPDWQAAVVDFRIRYCMRRLDLLPAPPPPETNSVARTRVATPPPAPTRLDERQTATAQRATKALSNLIEASRRQLLVGNVASARDGLLNALRISPDDHTVRLLLGFAQCQTGQFEDAVTVLDNLIEDNPTNAQAYLYRGSARVGMGRIDDAVADIEQSIKLNPSSHEARYDLAQALLMKSPPDTANAREHYRKAVALGGAPDPDLEARLK